jgi:hypothetical protein
MKGYFKNSIALENDLWIDELLLILTKAVFSSQVGLDAPQIDATKQ